MSYPPDPGTPDPGAPAGLSDEQRAFLTAQAAAHAVNAPNPAGDQAATAAQMTDRGPALPVESEYDALMAALRAQSEQIAALQSQVGVMQKQADERTLESGGPPVIRYAQAAADKVAALAAAHPDLGPDHFAAPKAAAADLLTEAQTLSKAGGSAAAVESAAGRLETWLTKTHWRTGRKFIDFSAVADDVATAVEEAVKLAA